METNEIDTRHEDEVKPYVDSLRQVADFFESHPTLKLPFLPQNINLFFFDKDELLSVYKGTGKTAEKIFADSYVYLRLHFGVINIDLCIQRDKVCTLETITRKVLKQVPTTFVEQEVEETINKWNCPESIFEEPVQTDINIKVPEVQNESK